MPHAAALASAEAVRAGGRHPQRMVAEAMRPLAHAGVALRHEDTWFAPNLADLAAWVADGAEYREDSGTAVNPELPPELRPSIPAQQDRARVAA